MGPALSEPAPLLLREGPGPPRPRGQRTLGEALEAARLGLQAGAGAECPVCGAEMRLEGAAGRCTGCGATLS